MSDIRILKGYGFEELSKKKIENARIGEAISETVNPGELKRALLDVLDEEHSKAFAFYKSLNSDKEIVACFITGAVDINEVVPKGGQIIDLNKITGVDDDVLTQMLLNDKAYNYVIENAVTEQVQVETTVINGAE